MASTILLDILCYLRSIVGGMLGPEAVCKSEGLWTFVGFDMVFTQPICFLVRGITSSQATQPRWLELRPRKRRNRSAGAGSNLEPPGFGMMHLESEIQHDHA